MITHISNDGKTLWIQFGVGWPYKYVASGVRDSIDEPFGGFKYVQLRGRPLLGDSACVVPELEKIFYTAPTQSFENGFWEAWTAELHPSSTDHWEPKSIAGRTFYIQFLAGRPNHLSLKHLWGNYTFTHSGAIRRNDRQVGTWSTAQNHKWAAGADGFNLHFTSPKRMDSFAVWATENDIVGGAGAIFSGELKN